MEECVRERNVGSLMATGITETSANTSRQSSTSTIRRNKETGYKSGKTRDLFQINVNSTRWGRDTHCIRMSHHTGERVNQEVVMPRSESETHQAWPYEFEYDKRLTVQER